MLVDGARACVNRVPSFVCLAYRDGMDSEQAWQDCWGWLIARLPPGGLPFLNRLA